MEGTFATVTMFAGNFAPANWEFCAGQLVSISSNTTLFALIGNYYGGDGRTTFALPDLRGRAVVGQGEGPGLASYALGMAAGTSQNTITALNMPLHSHTANLSVKLPVNGDLSNADSPENTFPGPAPINIYATGSDAYAGALNVTPTLGQTGAGTPISNMQPFLGINYIICTSGIFPSRP